MVDTVTIPKKEYQRLKRIEKALREVEIKDSVARSIEDLRAGRVIRYE